MRTSLPRWLCAAALAAACSSTPKPVVVEPETPPPDPSLPQPQDQVFTFDALPVGAHVYSPEALSAPSMDFRVAGRRSVADQRKRYQKTKGEERFVEGDALCVLLWDEGKQTSKEEARAVYRELVTGGKAPEGLVMRAAFVEQLLGDEARARALYDELVVRFATSAQAPVYRAYKAYYQVRAGDDASARATMTDVIKGEGDPPEVAYVAAWLAFRKGEQAAAWTQLAAAAAKWGAAALAQLRRDVLLFASRADADPERALAVLAELARKDGADVPALAVALADQYLLAGRYERRSQVLEQLSQKGSASAVAQIRYLQADVAYRLNRPEKAADLALASWKAAGEAADMKPEEKEALAKYVVTLARASYSIYGYTYDARYGEAAKRLFDAYLAIPGRADAAEVKKLADDLQARLSNPEVQKTGLHEQQVMRQRLLSRIDDVVACYEGVLQRSPALAGTVQVTLDVSERGEVTAATLDPAPGNDGLGAVSTCLSDRLKGWGFPSRTRPGLTRMLVSFALSPAKAG